MKTLRLITALAAVALAIVAPASAHPATAEAAVTTDIGGVEAGGAANGGMDWDINYDDSTRNVVATASGSGFCAVVVQVTASVSRIIVFQPAGASTSQNPDIAAAQANADFIVTADGQPHVILSGVAPAAVKRILGKATQTIGGLQATDTWSRF